jgi:hypothetical protein
MGLPTDDKHLVVRWMKPNCKILVSIARKGNSASVHFASDKAGLRHLRQGIEELHLFCMGLGWCESIRAAVSVPSVARMIQRCGFTPKEYNKEHTVYVRVLI